MKNKILKINKLLLTAVVGLSMLVTPANTLGVNATNSGSSSSLASYSSKSEYLTELSRHYNEITYDYAMSDLIKNKLTKKYNEGYNAIKAFDEDENSPISLGTIYHNAIEDMDKCIENLDKRTGDAFLMFSNYTSVPTVNTGSNCTLILSLINLGSTQVHDLIITPEISADDKWPFVVTKANEPIYIAGVYPAVNLEDAMTKRMDFSCTFKVKDDLETGIYEVPFNICYSTDGKESTSKKLSTFVYINGKDSQTESAPRIIVTGFTTEPENVYAGEKFMLHVTVKNTSNALTVQNVLFDLEASVSTGGSQNTESYAVFLPTSGSNSVFKDHIAPNETFQIDIEMQAKADLAQKPYQLKINMSYDYIDGSKKLVPVAANSAEVSIPVKQEAKVETGTEEVLPNDIAVGEESNIMFDVFNTGKTTLYNVKVTFDSDTISSGMSYLGNITAGETKNVDTNVTGLMADMGEGTVKAIISYEDENGNVSSIEKNITLSVHDNGMGEGFDEFEGDFYDDGFIDEAPKSGSKLWLILCPIIGIVIIVVIVIVIKIRKSKRSMKADLKALDEDDDL